MVAFDPQLKTSLEFKNKKCPGQTMEENHPGSSLTNLSAAKFLIDVGRFRLGPGFAFIKQQVLRV